MATLCSLTPAMLLHTRDGPDAIVSHRANSRYFGRYGPLNKADVITKWFASVDAPQDEVIVVIDPDNWFTGEIRPWVDKVKKGHAVAQAAFYYGATSQVNVAAIIATAVAAVAAHAADYPRFHHLCIRHGLFLTRKYRTRNPFDAGDKPLEGILPDEL